jgi:hypothetical protein
MDFVVAQLNGWDIVFLILLALCLFIGVGITGSIVVRVLVFNSFDGVFTVIEFIFGLILIVCSVWFGLGILGIL